MMSKRKKIYVSRKERVATILYTVIILGIAIYGLAYMGLLLFTAMEVAFLSFFLLPVWGLIIWGGHFRILSYVENLEDSFVSYIWGQQLGVVYKNQPIYYAVVYWASTKEQYVLISNEKFEYHSGKNHLFKGWIVPWLDSANKETLSTKIFGIDGIMISYDVKKMIALPYKRKYHQMLEFTEWIEVKPID